MTMNPSENIGISECQINLFRASTDMSKVMQAEACEVRLMQWHSGSDNHILDVWPHFLQTEAKSHSHSMKKAMDSINGLTFSSPTPALPCINTKMSPVYLPN